MLPQNTEMWTGGNDIEEEGKWKWDGNNNSFSFDKWAYPEPNGDVTENCLLIIQRTGNPSFTWNDGTCDTIMLYMCQIFL